tara:strand:+ start:1838 stop:2770 length:933 start_codon:yes stop_codon:yes gene_type:complete
MSTEVSIFKQENLPGKLVGLPRSRLAEELSKASSGTTSRRIQTNVNGTFKRLINGEQIGNAISQEINVIIVWTLPNVSRIWYKEKYDPDSEPTLPNCWSNLGDKPEKEASNPQHANCVECPQNIKGSGANGSRACRYQRRISVLVEGDKSGEVYQFNVPAKSLFGKGLSNVHPFESYLSFLSANGEAPDQVVTNISYDPNASTMELLFTPLRNVSDDEWVQVKRAQSSPDAKRYTRITVAQADNVTKLPPPDVIRSDEPDEEVTEQAVVEEPPKVVQEEIAEPVKRAPKKEESPVKDDIANVLSAWAEDE